MSLGYNSALYLLRLDHRQCYVIGMFHFKPSLTPDEQAAVTDSKQRIYDGFREAVDNGVPASCAGILLEEEFGSGILHDAIANGYVIAVSVEKSGSDEFEYDGAFAQHIEAFGPTFANVLVRYNPDGNPALNLRRLTDDRRKAAQRFMFELLVPATKAQMEQVHANKDAYDRQIRPTLMRQAIAIFEKARISHLGTTAELAEAKASRTTS